MPPLSTMSSVLLVQNRCRPARRGRARLMRAWARFLSDARGGGSWVHVRRSRSDGSKRRGKLGFRAQRCRTMPPLITMPPMSSERNRCAPARRGYARLLAAFRKARGTVRWNRCTPDDSIPAGQWARCVGVRGACGVRSWVNICRSRNIYADGSERRRSASFRVQRCCATPPLSTTPALCGGARMMKSYTQARARCASNARGGGAD